MAKPTPQTPAPDAEGPKRRGRKMAPVAAPDQEPGPDNTQEWMAWMIFAAGITQAEAAELIARQTGRPCSPRSVRAWLAEPHLETARACPEWAVKALRRKLVATKKLSS